MKRIALVAAMVLGSSMAHASLFDNQVDVQEASNALIHCAEQAKQLAPNEQAYLGDVVGQHTKISDRVDSKSYAFNSLVGGAAFGPPAQAVATLIVTATVTQPPMGRMDAPASISWSCQLSK
jgi:hypothetical protein